MSNSKISYEGGRALKLKYIFLAVNALLVLASIGPLYNLHVSGMSIKNLILVFIIFIVVINISSFLIFWIIDKIYQRFEKRAAEKFSVYHWLGNPVNPITLKDSLSNIKEFTPENFQHNCSIVKEKILSQLSEAEELRAEELRSYKRFLDLKNESPRLTSLLSSFKTILIAIITATILTFLNFNEFSYTTFAISYFVLIISAGTLLVSIDYMSKTVDRDKLLLVLVNECIEETENLRAQ